MTNLNGVELNIQLNSGLIDLIAEALRVATADQKSHMAFLVKVRKQFLADMDANAIRNSTERLENFCNHILSRVQ